MIKLSIDQQLTLNGLMDWFKSIKKDSIVTLGGYAGTGKTTLLAIFRQKLEKEKKGIKVAFCSYTGKATRVLKEKLIEGKAMYPSDSVSTIHSLIYSPMLDDKERIIGWEKKDELDTDLIIVDEASMIDEYVWQDMLSFKAPIVAIGDHGQLPPVKGKFNLMEKPIFKLEQIHRQAADNPIIKLSIIARERGHIPFIEFGKNIKKIKKNADDAREEIGELLESYNEDTLLLCGYNNTRVKLNQHIRGILGYETPLPTTNDKVICLRNNHMEDIFNGMIGKVRSISKENKEWYFADIEMSDGKLFSGPIYIDQFNNPQSLNHTDDRSKTMNGDLFDFGYALTVHKAQGSQARKVILFEERFKSMSDEDWRRWLYTAVTRAEEELVIIG